MESLNCMVANRCLPRNETIQQRGAAVRIHSKTFRFTFSFFCEFSRYGILELHGRKRVFSSIKTINNVAQGKTMFEYPYSMLEYPYSMLEYPYSMLEYPYSMLEYPYSMLEYPYSMLEYPYSMLEYPYSMLEYPY